MDNIVSLMLLVGPFSCVGLTAVQVNSLKHKLGDDKTWVWVELINACLELVARYLERGDGYEVDNRPLTAAWNNSLI